MAVVTATNAMVVGDQGAGDHDAVRFDEVVRKKPHQQEGKKEFQACWC